MAVTLKIGNSYSQVEGLDRATFSKLKKLLSYLPEGSAFTQFVRPKYLIDAKGNFPTGLLNKVQEFLVTFHANVVDSRVKPRTCLDMPRLNLDRVPYESQIAAAKSISESLTGRSGVVMPTGTGKSLTLALAINMLQVRTLVVVPNVGIRDQLREQFLIWFGKTDHIRIENIDSKSLQKLKDFDCLICDEGHHSAASTYQKLNRTVWAGIYYRVFFSATYFRNQASERLLFEGIAGKVTYELSYTESVDKGYIVPVESFYYDIPKQKTEAYTWAQVYSELIVNNQKRNEIIALTALRLNKAEKPSLILVKELAHGNILSEMTGIPFMNGQDAESRKYLKMFNQGEINSLIGTTGVLGEGIDTVRAEYIIIAGLGKAKSQFMQMVGRGVRRSTGKESAKVVLFRDKSHRFCISHYNSQKKILITEYGSEPILLLWTD